jgi:glutamine synthetase
MTKLRSDAINVAVNREIRSEETCSARPVSYFAEKVFTLDKMQAYLPENIIEAINQCIEGAKQVDREIAGIVASGMKNWAISHGVTHYTHWFQPLTGGTAEKHDTFLEFDKNGKAIEILSGASLAQQESDASSFPNGGIRNTFEARGYSAWDPSSPAFIIEDTLCIPTIFISYTGEALDFKAPLLKSLYCLDQEATAVCQFVDKNITKVFATLGIEQEYFLIDEAIYNSRPDLVIAGRTLFGHESAKGQQLEDHYFGSIPERIRLFMSEFEKESWKLGIPVKTRHNEVAPGQFEFASIYEEANLANDHNQLTMFLLRKIARKHNLRVLLHEKPYAGVNGSGKHNNWSLATNTGRNLLSPGKNPKSNLLFLTFFINTIKAVHDHADLLRASIASAGNDFRLGANEAPPAIMSVFIGSYLEEMLNDFTTKIGESKLTAQEKTNLKLNIIKIPQILLDNTDRNRTSPFAFTGNKFEFRAVGSSDNCAAAMIALNTAVAAQLKSFGMEVEKLVSKSFEKDEAMYIILKDLYLSVKKRVFNGNGYSNEWKIEAEKRGLSNIDNTPDALVAYCSKSTKRLFASLKVLSETELEARYEIKAEKYYKNIQIESRIMADLVKNHIVPVALKYQNLLLTNIRSMKDIFSDAQFKKLSASQLSMVTEIAEHVDNLLNLSEEMTEARKIANNKLSISERASDYRKKVFPYFETIRNHADKLELIVSDDDWPLPKYREMLFFY